MHVATSLLKTFNTVLNDIGADLALIALKEEGFGPFQPHAHRGFLPREIQAITRALSYPEVGFGADNGHKAQQVGIRMTVPAHRSLLGIPLRCHRRVCGALVLGRKDTGAFTDKDRRQLEAAAQELETAITKAGLMPGLPALSSPEQAGPEPAFEMGAVTHIEASAMESLLEELRVQIPYDRALLTRYEPGTKLLVSFLSYSPGHLEWRQGQTFTLDGSAAGWVLRHRKLRLDRDLASSQGRFLDYKELYKEKFKTALVLPLRKDQEIIGTLVLAARTADVYNTDMVRATAGHVEQLAKFLLTLGLRPAAPPPGEPAKGPQRPGPRELSFSPADAQETRQLLQRQERQAAIRELAGFLEKEIQPTLIKARQDLEESLPADDGPPPEARARVEQAYRDLLRVEAIVNEVLDHAKPLELHPRTLRIQDVLESALALIADDIERHHITVTRQFAEGLPAIKADEGKLQQVFLSILKNALEAMTPYGHITLEAVPHKGTRGRHEVAITMQNDGAPIPTEHIGKIFEPGFTTKETGLGLGLSSVKKIIEEHRGQLSIASGPGQGTTVIIRLPAHSMVRPQGRRRRRPRRR